MTERAPYSRVYWAIVDDPRFRAIYDDNNHLATWLRLLITADALWPASCELPAKARRRSLGALTESGLIEVSGNRYRVHGLDAERGRRRDAARTGTKRDSNGTQTGTERDSRPGPKTRRDETSRANAPGRGDSNEWRSSPPRPNTVDKNPLLSEIRAGYLAKEKEGA